MKTCPLLTLIADDSEDDRLLFSHVVRSIPWLRLTAITRDGVEALAYLNGSAPYGNRLKFPYPKLILLDYQMPGYDGLEVLASMPDDAQRPNVILWSNSIETVNQGLAYKLGATLVCSKPVTVAQIQSVLESIFLGTSHRNGAGTLAGSYADAPCFSPSLWPAGAMAPSLAQG